MNRRLDRRLGSIMLSVLLLAAACGGAPEPASRTAPAFDAATLPVVVARVGPQEITREELVRRANTVHRSEPDRLLDLAYFQEVLENMISSELLYQESKARGFSFSEGDLNARISAMRDRFPSPEEFEQTLKAQGLTPAEMGRTLGKDIAVSRYLDNVVISKVSVTEEEAQSYFEERQDEIRADDQLRVRHILLRLPEDAPEPAVERVRQKLQGIRSEILAGGDFAQLAREYSQDPGSAPLGGDLDWISRGTTVPAFDRAAYALETGELSPVIRSSFGLHVIQVVERRPGPPVAYEDAKDQLLSFLRERKIEEQIGLHVAELRKSAKVEVFI